MMASICEFIPLVPLAHGTLARSSLAGPKLPLVYPLRKCVRGSSDHAAAFSANLSIAHDAQTTATIPFEAHVHYRDIVLLRLMLTFIKILHFFFWPGAPNSSSGVLSYLGWGLYAIRHKDTYNLAIFVCEIFK